MSRVTGSAARAEMAAHARREANLAAHAATKALRAAGMAGYGLFVLCGLHSVGVIVAVFGALAIFDLLGNDWPEAWAEHCMMDIPRDIADKLALGRGRFVAAPAARDAAACRAAGALGASANQAANARSCNAKLQFFYRRGGRARRRGDPHEGRRRARRARSNLR
jgi:hypothetical protein